MLGAADGNVPSILETFFCRQTTLAALNRLLDRTAPPYIGWRFHHAEGDAE